MPDKSELIVVKLVNIPDIHCVLRLDFEISRHNPFVPELISGCLNINTISVSHGPVHYVQCRFA